MVGGPEFLAYQAESIEEIYSDGTEPSAPTVTSDAVSSVPVITGGGSGTDVDPDEGTTLPLAGSFASRGTNRKSSPVTPGHSR